MGRCMKKVENHRSKLNAWHWRFLLECSWHFYFSFTLQNVSSINSTQPVTTTTAAFTTAAMNTSVNVTAPPKRQVSTAEEYWK